MTYAIVTVIRDEAEALSRLTESVLAQTVAPSAWILVDTGARDETRALADRVAHGRAWITVVEPPGEPDLPSAFKAGTDRVPSDVDVIVKHPASVTTGPDYFERILDAFEDDPALVLTTGACHEHGDTGWRPTFATASLVRGPSRSYRRAFLAVLPTLAERPGSNALEELHARALGWHTRVLANMPFYWHREIAIKNPHRGGAGRWIRQGAGAHYMGYRPSFLVVRSLHHAIRRPEAIAMIWGYAQAAAKREPRSEKAVREYVRKQQRLARLLRRRSP